MKPPRQFTTMLVASALLAVTFGAPAFAGAQPLYAVTDLGKLPSMTYSVATDVNAPGAVLLPPVSPGPQRTFIWSNGQRREVGPFAGQPALTSAIAINDAAQATGYSLVCSPTCVAHAFLWTNGAMIDIGTVGGLPQSRGMALNNSGQVAGYAFQAANDTQIGRALLFSNGRTTDLGPLPGGEASAAYGINNLGQVVGTSRTGTSPHVHATLWSGGTVVDLDNDPGRGSVAHDINDAGDVMGQIWFEDGAFNIRGFHYRNGVLTVLGPDRTESSPVRMNEAGHVVGGWQVAQGVRHPFLYAGGVMADLGTFGGSFGEAYGINAADHVVGRANTAAEVNHAFVYRDGTLFDLNDRLVANPGWTVLSGATDINDAGQIVGWGTIGGETHGFRLDPVVPTD